MHGHISITRKRKSPKPPPTISAEARDKSRAQSGPHSCPLLQQKPSYRRSRGRALKPAAAASLQPGRYETGRERDNAASTGQRSRSRLVDRSCAHLPAGRCPRPVLRRAYRCPYARRCLDLRSPKTQRTTTTTTTCLPGYLACRTIPRGSYGGSASAAPPRARATGIQARHSAAQVHGAQRLAGALVRFCSYTLRSFPGTSR